MSILFEVEPPSKTSKDNSKKEERSQRQAPARSQQSREKIWTVQALTRRIRMLVESKFRMIALEGELSNVRASPQGHIYFVVKDKEAQIRAVIFRREASQLKFKLEEGLEVLIRGHLTVYEARGEYQIKASSIEPKGVGALQLAFEQLKARLRTEGLFDEEHKRPLPFLPRRIAIITSPTGSVIHDMLNVLARRYPGIPVLLFPASVQGEQAVPSLIEGVRYMNSIRVEQELDVLIIGRGGGSLEDLWAFNNEELARTLFESEIPVISAVGHETDFTIADFVSDVRTPTPSVAMELAVPLKQDLQDTVKHHQESLQYLLKQTLERYHEALSTLKQRLNSPESVIQQYVQRVDDQESLLHTLFKHLLEDKKSTLRSLHEKNTLLNPTQEILKQKQSIELLKHHLLREIRNHVQHTQQEFHKQAELLDSLSPLSVMKRGYSLVSDEKQELLKSVADVELEQVLNVRLQDGVLKTQVLEKNAVVSASFL